MSKKEKILIFILTLLVLATISLIALRLLLKSGNNMYDDELRDVILSEEYELVGISEKGEEGDFVVDHYYSEKNFVTCIVVHIGDYDIAKNNVKTLQKDDTVSGYISEIEEKDNYTELSTYGNDGYFKVSLAIDSYEIEIFTSKYQDKVEELANKIIRYYNK